MCPFSQTFDFEAGFDGAAGGLDFEWIRFDGNPPSSGTGPSGPFEGTWYMYTETSSPVANSEEAEREFGPFDFATYKLSVTFRLHRFGAAMDNGGYTSVDVENPAGSGTFDLDVFRFNGQNASAEDTLYIEYTEDLDAAGYTTGSRLIRFRTHVSDSGSAFQNDSAVDIIVVSGPDRATFKLDGVTRDEALAALATVRCVLLKHDGAAEASRVYSVVGHVNSDGSGNFSFTGVADSDPRYMVMSFDIGTPIVRGVTNDNLQPVAE